MGIIELKTTGEYFIKIPYDADLLIYLKEQVKKLEITSGTFTIIGALRRAVLHYYIQSEKTFHKNVFDQPLEIASGIGNVAVKNGETIVHCHLVVADKMGNCYGGHLAEGSIVFAGEVQLRGFSPTLNRKYDLITGLNLFEI